MNGWYVNLSRYFYTAECLLVWIVFLAEQEMTKQESKGSLAELIKERDQVCRLLSFICVYFSLLKSVMEEFIWALPCESFFSDHSIVEVHAGLRESVSVSEQSSS